MRMAGDMNFTHCSISLATTYVLPLCNCPAYLKLTEEQKDEVAFLMPKLIHRCLTRGQGYANDEDIFDVMGHVVGHPNRHKEGVRPLESFDLGRCRAGFYTAPTMMTALENRSHWLLRMFCHCVFASILIKLYLH